MSSVVDIQMKEGNLKKSAVEGGIGLITSQLTLEGPIKKDKASFIVSGKTNLSGSTDQTIPTAREPFQLSFL